MTWRKYHKFNKRCHDSKAKRRQAICCRGRGRCLSFGIKLTSIQILALLLIIYVQIIKALKKMANT